MKIDYQKLLDEVMLDFVRKVLVKVQKEGLPSENHFYISFLTSDPLVTLSNRMRNIYPKEMTIVLQNQFEDLLVKEESFSVKLSFNRMYEIVEVPFRSITSFTDPSVNFSLQFNHRPPSTKSSNEITLLSIKDEAEPDNIIILDKFRKNKPS